MTQFCGMLCITRAYEVAASRRNAAVALSYLCSHKRSQPKALADNVAVHMLRLAKSEDPETKSCAAQGLCALTHNKPTRAKLVKDGVLPHIVRQAGSGNVRGHGVFVGS